MPFDENFKHYGYEDVLLGKSITDKGYHIVHIDNPILLDDYETNYQFINKTEEACRTLYEFRKELRGYSKLIHYAELAKRLKIAYPLIRILYPELSLQIKARLLGNNPSVFCLIYISCYITCILIYKHKIVPRNETKNIQYNGSFSLP